MCTLSGTETGHYLLLLCAQWDSKEAQSLPSNLERLTLICGGERPSAYVLAKFDEVTVGDQKFLRNQRLAEEWARATADHEGRVRGGKRTAERGAERPTERGAEHADSGTQSGPEPEPEPDITDTYLPTARARNPSESYNRAETAAKDNERGLQLRLGEMLNGLVEHENSRLMLDAWTRKISAYEDRNGRRVRGVSDFRMIRGADRIAKCIEDALTWRQALDSGKVVSK